MSIQVKWCVDEAAYSLLCSPRLNLKKKIIGYKEVPAASILFNESRYLNTRHCEIFSQERVDRYAEDMKAGATFPCLVTHECPANLEEIIGGTHRFKGAESLGCPVYRVLSLSHLTDAEACMVRIALNTIHGLEESKDSLAEHVARHILKHGKGKNAVARAAQTFGLDTSTLYRAIRIEEVRAEAASCRLNVDRLSNATLDRLAQIDNKAIQLKAIEAAARRQATADKVKNLVDQIKQSPPAHVDRVVADWETTFQRKSRQPKNTLVENMLTYLQSFDNAVIKIGSLDALTQEQVDLFHEQWGHCAKRVNEILVKAQSPEARKRRA